MSKVVLGGGLSGLSAAYYLLKRLPNQAVTIIEASDRLGGWIKSSVINDKIIFEQGPRTIRPGGPTGANTLSVIEDLSISDQILPISLFHPAAKNRMIYANKQLHSLPSNISSVLTTQPPFSKPLIWFLTQDLFARKKTSSDESIYDFINRRFGKEFADYLISSLICGICAGDAKEISVKFLMETLFEYEQQYGNITTGMLLNIFKKPKNKIQLKGLSLRAKREKWQMYSFKNGIETLPEAMHKYISKHEVDVLLKSKCNQLEFANKEVLVHFDNGKSLKTDHVISALPSESLGYIVQTQHPDLANLLCGIKNATVGVVNLCYKGNLINKPGFGFLVPPRENIPILGVIFDSCSFPRSEDTVLSVMMGGKWFEQLFGDNPSEDTLLQTAKQQIENILEISEEPTHFKVTILRKCIPQYVVGHRERINKIEEYITKNKLPLSLCGASYYGIGVNDVIFSAKNSVDNLPKINDS